MKRTPLKRGKLNKSNNRFTSSSFINKTSSKQKKVHKKDEEVYEIVYKRAKGRCEQSGEVIPTPFRDPDSGKVLDKFRFCHVLTKGAYPEARHDPENLMYTTFEIHQQWEFSCSEDRKKLGKLWAQYLKMKQKYSNFKIS